ncbi:MAG: ribosome biogenesis GTP-binding protein YihA/YsxC [Clostridia bacterium]|nr:ribosome biogenesis GTP-binding protein YihA/YsxC [Clostridia bacterium]
MLKITNAEFITSAAKKEQFIKTDKPIIAVCGKSNVGKSSFINMLANRKKLAKVSKDPGRTRLVNYFDFGEFILADLPGYGFARVSKEEKTKWAKLLDCFFADKENIAHVFTLADIRHDPTADDRQMLDYLYYHIIPFTVIATKADKLSKAGIAKNVKNIAAVYKCGVDNVIATSSETRFGLEAVLGRIESIIHATYQTVEEDV